jgi:hypothetical protein
MENEKNQAGERQKKTLWMICYLSQDISSLRPCRRAISKSSCSSISNQKSAGAQIAYCLLPVILLGPNCIKDSINR